MLSPFTIQQLIEKITWSESMRTGGRDGFLVSGKKFHDPIKITTKFISYIPQFLGADSDLVHLETVSIRKISIFFSAIYNEKYQFLAKVLNRNPY